MLYVLIEAQRAQLEKLQNNNGLLKLGSRIFSENKGCLEDEQSDKDVVGQYLAKEPVSSLSQTQIQDLEWFTLSPQKKYAFSSYGRNDPPLIKRVFIIATIRIQWLPKGEWPLFWAKLIWFFDLDGW
jgi:hypothetical protein